MVTQHSILVMEDDASMRELLASVLEDEGHRVVAVGRGQEAVEVAGRETLDLVVLDVRMEGLDGLDALARMRDHLNGAATLVVTGYASEADSVRALRLGVSDYLRKPFDLAAFLERVNRLLAETRRRRLREAREERLRALTRWALVALTRALEGRPLPPGAAEALEKTSALAGRLAAGAGLESPESEEVEAGAVLLAAARCFGATVPDLGDCAPHAAAEAVAEGPGLAARVADLAVAAACEDPDPAARWPGRFDPLLLQGLPGARGAMARVPPRGRALLSLGRGLVQAGDHANARRAYARVTEAGTPRETVQGWLGLAETACRAGQDRQAVEMTRAALAAARQVGPAETGRAALRGGLLLMQAGLPEAREILQEASQIAGRLALEPAASRAHLALAAVDRGEAETWEGPLQILLLPEHELERQEDLPWLLPALLEAGVDPERGPGRLVRGSPHELARVLEAGALSAAGRRTASGLLELAAGALSPDLLGRLAGDPDPEVRQRAAAALRRSGGPPACPVLRIRSLGPLEVSLGDQPIEERAWRTARVKHFFAYLAAHSRPVPEERILEDFWPDDPGRGRHNLYWTTSAIRRPLRGWCPPGQEPVLRTRGFLSLNPDLPRWHDLEELKRAVAVAAGPDRAAAARRVLDLARGPFLEGCYMDWVLPLRTRVEAILRQALTDLHQHYHQRGFEGEALECALRLLDLDPYSQEACRAIMLAHTALGRPQEAIRQFEVHCRSLRQEMAMEPSLELVELYHRARLGLK